MQLPASDPYSILHASCWGKLEKEDDYIKTSTIDIPNENDLNVVEPHEFQVLDFGSKCPILPNRTSKMLIRDEYEELWKYVEGDRCNPRRWFGGVVFTGHPGIGKSFGIYFYLFQNLLVSHPIALQTDKNSFFLFVDSGVYLVRFTSNTAIYDIQSHLRQLGCTEGMIALVDSSERSPSPAPIFLDLRFPFYVIQATDPSPSRWKEWVKQSSATVLVSEPWSWAEIFICSSFSITPPPSAADLYDVFEKYGPVPKVCFHLVGDEREIHAYNQELLREPADAPSYLKIIARRGVSEEFSHLSSALLMIPDAHRSPLVRPTSKHTIQAVASCIPPADISEIHSLLEVEPLTSFWAQELYRIVTMHSILKETFSYDFTFSSLSANAWHSTFGLPNETKPTLLSSVVTIESLPAPLPINHCYVFDKADELRSYDAVIRTCSPYNTNIYLLKVVAESESPIFLEELDRLEEKFKDFYAGKPGGNTMRSRFLKQPYSGTGKYSWADSAYFEQAIASV